MAGKMKKTILITGGTGFIGSFLRNYYTGVHTIFAPGHSVLDLTNGESVDKFFERHNIDIVIHCALAGRDRINAVDNSLAMQNLEMFSNLWRNKHKFGKLINCGTGNEFDTGTNIEQAAENEFYNHLPKASYGYAKNIIARIVEDTPQFYNLRFFGVFHYSESPRRFFKLIYNATDESPFRIFQDQYFDFINLEDIVPMIDAIINNETNEYDVNMVYEQKYLQSELAYMFADIHNIPHGRIIVEHKSSIHFTGKADKLAQHGFQMQGLEAGFRKYKK
jgi:nucleoside-diphosphate-sugar epimerase